MDYLIDGLMAVRTIAIWKNP